MTAPMRVLNLFSLPDPPPADELFEVLARSPEGDADPLRRAGSAPVRVERIVSTGQSTPAGTWYDQDQDEWVALLAGTATLSFEDGRTIDLGPGDALMIPAHVRHRVERTSRDPACVWIAVHGRLGG